MRAGLTVANGLRATIMPHIKAHVLDKSTIYTDEFIVYDGLLRAGYPHKRVHHAAKVYASGDVHTNTIEGFSSLMKRGIGGVYNAVSAKHLQGYLNEYAWRYNHRDDGRAMFETLLLRAVGS